MEITPEAIKKQYQALSESLKAQKGKPSATVLPKVANCIDDINSYHINATKLYSGDKFRDYLLTVITNIISSYRVTHRNRDLDVIHDLVNKVQAVKADTVYYVNDSDPKELIRDKPLNLKQLKKLLVQARHSL